MNEVNTKRDAALYHASSEEINATHAQVNSFSMPCCHYHSAYEIYYLINGERYYFIHDKTYHIKKGDLVLIPPNCIHATYNVKNYKHERYVITFRKRHIQEFVDLFKDIDFYNIFNENIYVISPTPNNQIIIENIIENLYKTSSNNDAKTLLLLELLFFVNNFCNSDVKPFENDISATHKTVSDAISYINNNYASEISLNQISNELFISSCYLSRSFKKITGSSFTDYVNNVRVLEAKKLLKTTNLSVTSIALSVGFKNATHFGRIFKKATGYTPLQYKKLN